MNSDMIRPEVIIIALIVLILIAIRFNLYSQNGVRHIHRHYFGLLMLAFFFIFFFIEIREKLLANLPIAIPVGIVLGIVIYLLSKRWFACHFDGKSLLLEPRTKQYIRVFIFCLLAPFIYEAFEEALEAYFYPALGALLISWAIGTVLSMVHVRSLERKLGHPIFEREALPPRAAN
ncbi:MAG: hypothetical protein IT366_14900 [Candidatus Hydrogenedentes bacterium]|nr:hypothetical protein [Candidatus Hydrogenedentota bacterium]